MFVAIAGEVVLSVVLRIVIEPFIDRSKQHLPYITIRGFSVDNVPMINQQEFTVTFCCHEDSSDNNLHRQLKPRIELFESFDTFWVIPETDKLDTKLFTI